MDRDTKELMYMFTILFLNQKGGVGKTTPADELAFALEHRGFTVVFVSTNPQGSSIHKVCDNPGHAESYGYRVVDTTGVSDNDMGSWCRAADIIFISMFPNICDAESIIRTYEIVKDSGMDVTTRLVVNNFYAFGRLDKRLVGSLESERILIIVKIPHVVALSQAAAEDKSVAKRNPYNHVIPALEGLTDSIINKKEKEYV